MEYIITLHFEVYVHFILGSYLIRNIYGIWESEVLSHIAHLLHLMSEEVLRSYGRTIYVKHVYVSLTGQKVDIFTPNDPQNSLW